jgi:hypothetical protein
MKLTGKTKVLVEKRVPETLWHLQIPHGLIRDRTKNSCCDTRLKQQNFVIVSIRFEFQTAYFTIQ